MAIWTQFQRNFISICPYNGNQPFRGYFLSRFDFTIVNFIRFFLVIILQVLQGFFFNNGISNMTVGNFFLEVFHSHELFNRTASTKN